MPLAGAASVLWLHGALRAAVTEGGHREGRVLVSCCARGQGGVIGTAPPS